MKKIQSKFKVLLIILTVLLLTFAAFLLIDSYYSRELTMFVNATQKIDKNEPKYYIDDYGYYSFNKQEDSKFRVLQLTDLHIGGSFLSYRQDRKALTAIIKLIDFTKPDLVIITGDMVYPSPLQLGSLDNLKSTQYLGKLMERLGVPWTVTFGNHDAGQYSFHSKTEIADYYASIDNSLFQKGPTDITGMGNSFINIRSNAGNIITTLVLLDSNMYAGDKLSGDYDNIHDDQIAWYRNQIEALSKERNGLVPSLAFWHIPINEYDDAWKLFKKGSNEVTYVYGKAGEDGEKVYAPSIRGNIFNVMVELGSTKGIFSGHDHLNDFSLIYKGIRLTYGKSIDYLAYSGIEKSTWQRGGTLIEIDEDASFNVSPILLEDIK